MVAETCFGFSIAVDLSYGFLAAVVHPGVQNHMVSILASALYAVADILAHFAHVCVWHISHSNMGTSSYLLIMLHLTQNHQFGFCSVSELVD